MSGNISNLSKLYLAFGINARGVVGGGGGGGVEGGEGWRGGGMGGGLGQCFFANRMHAFNIQRLHHCSDIDARILHDYLGQATSRVMEGHQGSSMVIEVH